MRLSFVVILLLVGDSLFAASCGKFDRVEGKVAIQAAGTRSWAPVKAGTKACVGDRVQSKASSLARIVMSDKNRMILNGKTAIVINKYGVSNGSKKVDIQLLYGKLRSRLKQKYKKKGEFFRVSTKSAVAGVRGTDFLTSYDQERQTNEVVTFEGEVAVARFEKNGRLGPSVPVKAGFSVNVSSNKRSFKPTRVPPQKMRKIDQGSRPEVGQKGKSSQPLGKKKLDETV
jgi:hypothetical protein